MLIDTDLKYWDAVTPLSQQLVEEVGSTLTVDTETNGLDPFGYNQLCGIGLAYKGETYYFPFRHQQGTNLDFDLLQNLLVVIAQADNLVGYNIKFDLKFLERDGYVVTDNQTWIDAIVMMRLVEPAEVKELGLTNTISRVFGEEHAAYDLETKKFLRKNKWQKDFSMAPADILGPYCEQDALWTERLYEHALKKIKYTDQEAVLELENQLTKVLYNMEVRGIAIDSMYATNSITRLEQRKEEVAQQIYGLAGQEFNIQSTQQVGEVFTSQGVYSPIKTPKGQDSWNEAALVQINNPIAGLIRQYRTLEKLRSTYLEPYAGTSIMHTSYCNWGAVTGRLSSREPNLQNIPRTHFKLADISLTEEIKEALKNRINAQITAKGITHSLALDDEVLQTWSFVGDEYYDEHDSNQLSIRRLFVPRPEYNLISFDYSQMEVRVFLSYLKNKDVDDMLMRNDVDFHSEAAKRAFDMTGEEDTFKFYRQMAKNITFGVIYGIGKAKLANQLNVSEKEALQYKNSYFKGLPGSKEFFSSVMKAVQERGWIKNRYGRIYVIDKDIAYKGVNYLVQGTSADILNERMIKVYDYLKDKKSNILLQVHDEIICEIHDSELREIPSAIRGLLEENSLGIPLKVDMEICEPSWASKKDFETPVEVTLEDYIDWG